MELSFKIYVTDTIRTGLHLEGKRWIEFAFPDKFAKNHKSADDVITDFVNRGGLVVKHGLNGLDDKGNVRG